MKSAGPALITLLAGHQFLMADLYTFTLASGSMLRYASADFDIVSGGNTFIGSGPRMKRGRTRILRGVEVDTLDVSMFADTTDLVNGVPMLQAIARGVFDGAKVRLERAFMANWGDTSAGTVVLFSGRVAETSISRTEAKLTVRSDLELLNVQMPRNLYQPGCVHTLYDGGCGVVKSSKGIASSVASGTTRSVVNCGLTAAASFYDQGTITFTSGQNAGVSRTVKAYTPGVLTLSYPLPVVPAIGDGFLAYPGCDKSLATCAAKFSNAANFRGYPFIPVAETAL